MNSASHHISTCKIHVPGSSVVPTMMPLHPILLMCRTSQICTVQQQPQQLVVMYHHPTSDTKMIESYGTGEIHNHHQEGTGCHGCCWRPVAAVSVATVATTVGYDGKR